MDSQLSNLSSFRTGVLSHFSYFKLFATLWTIAHQASLSMGFSRQEYRSEFPCSPPRDLPHPGIKRKSLKSPALAVEFFTTIATWESLWIDICALIQGSKQSINHNTKDFFKLLKIYVNINKIMVKGSCQNFLTISIKVLFLSREWAILAILIKPYPRTWQCHSLWSKK